jgi:hypothetical protein
MVLPVNAAFDEAHQATTSDSDEIHFVTDLTACDARSAESIS